MKSEMAGIRIVIKWHNEGCTELETRRIEITGQTKEKVDR